MSDDWRGHIVVCGLDGVGMLTVEQLHLAGVRVVVVDDGADAGLLRMVRGWDVPVIDGSSRRLDTLTAAGIAGAAAVICVLADDLHTLETALLVRDARPDVRVVVQLRNPAVGRALATIDIAVLDVAGLSAPSMVEACLRTGTHELELGGERFVATHVRADTGGTLRSVYGDLAPLAVIRGGEVTVCPGRDVRVRPGDAVTLLGTPEELREAELPGGTGPDKPRRRWWPTRLARVAWLARDLADRRLGTVLAALLVVMVVAVTVLRLGYREGGGTRMSMLDALYFTVETIGTVGYGDFSFRSQPDGLRLFAIGLMVVGAVLAAVFFALLTNALVTIRIEEALGRRRMGRLAGHVVVIGLGSIGVRVVERLVAAAVDVVVVEAQSRTTVIWPRRGPPARGWCWPTPPSPPTLATVRLDTCRAVAVLTSNDLVNLETALAVRDQLGARESAVPVVLRLFDRQLAATVRTQLRPRPGPVDRRAGRTVVRRRRARPGHAGHLLRRTAADAGRPVDRRGRWWPGRVGHAGPVGPDPGGGDRAGQWGRPGAPAPAGHPVPRRRSGLPHRTVRGAFAGTAARHSLPGPAARTVHTGQCQPGDSARLGRPRPGRRARSPSAHPKSPLPSPAVSNSRP